MILECFFRLLLDPLEDSCMFISKDSHLSRQDNGKEENRLYQSVVT